MHATAGPPFRTAPIRRTAATDLHDAEPSWEQAMKHRTDPGQDDVDLARVSADPRSIAIGWIVVFAFIALGLVAPVALPIVTHGYAAMTAPAPAPSAARPAPLSASPALEPRQRRKTITAAASCTAMHSISAGG